VAMDGGGQKTVWLEGPAALQRAVRRGKMGVDGWMGVGGRRWTSTSCRAEAWCGGLQRVLEESGTSV